MHFIYIINDIEIGNIKLNAEIILEKMLQKECWLFNSGTPNFSKINQGDKVLVYVAGRGRRNFVCSFEIADKIVNNGLIPTSDEEKVLFSMFDYVTRIENINIFEFKVNILDIKQELDFIKDKKNYGLFFRQSTKVISENDFNKILNFKPITITSHK